MSEDRRGVLPRAGAARRAEATRPRAATGRRRRRPLSDADVERYSRQLVLPEWSEAAQLALGEASVLVVGAGALGSPVAAYLAGAGVAGSGSSTTTTSSLEPPPPAAALHARPRRRRRRRARRPSCASSTPRCVVEPYQARFAPRRCSRAPTSSSTARTPSRPATRSTPPAARRGIPLVEGGVRRALRARDGDPAGRERVLPLRVPGAAAARCAPSCAEAGVLGPAAGVIGSLQALEALKLLAGPRRRAAGRLPPGRPRDHGFLRVHVSRRADCPDCGAL